MLGPMAGFEVAAHQVVEMEKFGVLWWLRFLPSGVFIIRRVKTIYLLLSLDICSARKAKKEAFKET